jgi:hypothetical protein
MEEVRKSNTLSSALDTRHKYEFSFVACSMLFLENVFSTWKVCFTERTAVNTIFGIL